MYNQQFNLVGINDIFTGFRNLYEAANNKFKNFVQGPSKVLGNNPPVLMPHQNVAPSSVVLTQRQQ